MGIDDLLEEIYEDEKPTINISSSKVVYNKRNNKKNGNKLPFLSDIKISDKNYNVNLKNIVKYRYEIETRKLIERFDQIQRTRRPDEFKALLIPLITEYENMYKSAEDEARKLKTYIDILLTKNDALYLPGISEKLSSLRIRLTDPFNDFSLTNDSEIKKNYRMELIKIFIGTDKTIKETINFMHDNLKDIIENNIRNQNNSQNINNNKGIYNLLYCWIIYGNLISQFTNKTIEINKLNILKREENQKNNFKKDNQRKDKRKDQRGGKKDKKKKGKNGDKQKKSPEEIFMDNLISKIKDFENWDTSKLVEEKIGKEFVDKYFDGEFKYIKKDYKISESPALPDNHNHKDGKYKIGKFENYKLYLFNENLGIKDYYDSQDIIKNMNVEGGLINNIKFKKENIDYISIKEITKLSSIKNKIAKNKSKYQRILIKDDNKYYSLTDNEFDRLFENSDKLKEYYRNYNLKNFNRIKDFPSIVSYYKNNIIRNVLYYCIFTVEFLGDFIKQIRSKYNIPIELVKPKEEKKNNERKNKNIINEDKNIVNENKVKNKKNELDELYKAKDELFKERDLLIKKSREKISNDEKEEIKILIKEISADIDDIKKEIQKLKNTNYH
jgi:hypothetical protein